jgi:solute carrier family 35 protein E3
MSAVEDTKWQAALYVLLNIVSATGVVFANKSVFQCGFEFTTTLTWLHTLFTMVGMALMAHAQIFEPKRDLPLACSYVGYIMCGNLSLQLNSVGLYQVRSTPLPCCVLC